MHLRPLGHGTGREFTRRSAQRGIHRERISTTEADLSPSRNRGLMTDAENTPPAKQPRAQKSSPVETGPVALVQLGHRVPDGFHGNWVGAV